MSIIKNRSTIDWIKFLCINLLGWIGVLMMITLPTAKGGAGLIFVITIPASIILSLILSVVYLFSCDRDYTEKTKSIVFISISIIIISLNFAFFPYP